MTRALPLALLAACAPTPPANPPTAGYPNTPQAEEFVRDFVGETMDWHPESTIAISWVAGPCLEVGTYTGERQDPCFIGRYSEWWDPPTAFVVDKFGSMGPSALAHELFHAWSDEILGYPDSGHAGPVWALEDDAKAALGVWEEEFRQPRTEGP